MGLPGGRNHYDGPGVDQVSVKQGPSAAAIQVGTFNHVRRRVDPKYQPTFDVQCQTLWTDKIYREQGDHTENIKVIQNSVQHLLEKLRRVAVHPYLC